MTLGTRSFFCTMLAAIWAAFLLASCSENKPPRLTLYCAAGLRHPVAELVNEFSAAHHCEMNVVYHGSGALLSQLQLSQGDLYLPAHHYYTEEANKLGLSNTSVPPAPVVELKAALVIRKGEDRIHSLGDLTKPGIRIAIAAPSAAIGKFTKETLLQHGWYEKLEPNIRVTKPTVNNVVEDVALGSVDATIAWSAVADQFDGLRIIEIPIFSAKPSHTSISVLKSSRHPELAEKFATFISTSKQSKEIFEKHGFSDH